ncbi:uncharacterized protein LOC119722954 isoform X2 [Patiria miniata]|uniref:Mis18 domain-containing protein n=1 Tax=Patiria miniata TaxID=46514 RepID=A0A913ZC00_PATMI|nr:uncharacterized protein LOC119722954 isoform X2 [Patiria miniata]
MAARNRDCGVSMHKEKTDDYEETEDDETAEDNSDVPVVLQCITSAVTPGKKLMTSTSEGIDLGSTYIHLLCKQCNEVVGKIYKTTSRQLDSLRDLYTLSIHHITSYQVGSRGQRADVGLQETLDLPTAKSLKDSILKIQVMICALNNRILNIENALELKEDADDQADNTAPEGFYNTTDAVNDHTKTKNLLASQQDKTATGHSESSMPDRDISGMTQSGRQYTAGKRSKETTSHTGSQGNKRSRFK